MPDCERYVSALREIAALELEDPCDDQYSELYWVEAGVQEGYETAARMAEEALGLERRRERKSA